MDNGTFRYSKLDIEDFCRMMKIKREKAVLDSNVEMTGSDIIRYFGKRGYRNFSSMGIINPTKDDLLRMRMKTVPGVEPRYDGDPLKSLIMNYAVARKMDPAFVMAVIRQESNFNPMAISHAGAIGLMQIMPATASIVAKKNITEEDLKNPILNLHIGTYHLRDLLHKYRHPITALSAWNAGEGAVQKYGPLPPYEETINFGASVMNHYRNYKKDEIWKK
ncbi:MAG: lytic transglycosylase domain-containing protein [Candidatus Zixiibacteriota bacterium]